MFVVQKVEELRGMRSLKDPIFQRDLEGSEGPRGSRDPRGSRCLRGPRDPRTAEEAVPRIGN